MTIEIMREIAYKIIRNVLEYHVYPKGLRIIELDENNDSLQIVWNDLDGLTNNLKMKWSLEENRWVGLDPWSKTFESIQ